MKNGIFETVLSQNKEYIRLVNENAPAEQQANQLKVCEILMKTMIVDDGLSEQYREYCEIKRAKGEF